MAVRTHLRQLAPECAAVVSGLLLAASFAPLEWKDAAWFALVPLMTALRSAGPRTGVRLGMVTGTVFWLLTIHWLTHVTVAGWIALSLYCALYIALFGGIVAWLMRRWGVRAAGTNLLLMLAAAAVWTSLEYLRSTLFTGFPWNPLGQSQYRNLTVIQAASWGGVYAVSAIMVWVSTAVTLTVLRYAADHGRLRRRWHAELIAALLVWALAHAQGVRALTRDTEAGPSVQVALIQPNIPQTEKWTPEYIDTIYERLESLTDWAIRLRQANLLVWPETAVPDDVRTSPRSYELVYRLATNGIPLLVGSMDTEWQDYDTPLYFNSSFLFDRHGLIVGEYDKQHLVVFGEYVPFRHALPFIKAMTPIAESFTAGRKSAILRIPGTDVPFTVLICFEDSVPRLARRAVLAGARFLVNQTNDAWFDPSSGSRQHMIHCVFRCVENRVPAVRATNTGVTCAIDRHGRIRDELRGDGGALTSGIQVTRVDLGDGGAPLTFYSRWGDVFALASTGVLGLCVLWMVLTGRKARPPANRSGQ